VDFLASRARLFLLIVVIAAAAATVLVAVAPGLSFAYRSSSVHVAIEAGGAVGALIAAFLVYQRLARSGSISDVILCAALVALGLSNVARAFAPSYDGHNNAVVWAPVAGSIVVAGGALAAATLPAGLRIRRRSHALLYVAAILVAGGAVVAVVSAFADRIPTGIDPAISPAAAHRPIVVGSASLLAVQLVAASLFIAAAVEFANRAERTGDELIGWLAIGSALAGVTRVNYFLFPSIYSHWIFTGDIFRALAFTAILIGAFRELAAHHQAAMRAAVVEERQRIARDLHDGLAQDLAYLSLQGSRGRGEDDVSVIASTAQEALFEARAVVSNLQLTDAPLPTAVTGLSRALTARHGVRLDLDIDESLEARAEERDDLLRVLSEATSNAVRHGQASEIRVVLRRTSDTGLIMSIADDGRGFDPGRNHGQGGGTGLEGMRARIERLGGRIEVRSRPDAGTTVEVALDRPRRPVG
jgi:signal transduction histidine kinase